MKPVAERNLYELLGVPFDAPEALIVEAWDRAERLHCPGSPVAATEVSDAALWSARLEEAIEILLDPIERGRYDASLLGEPRPCRCGTAEGASRQSDSEGVPCRCGDDGEPCRCGDDGEPCHCGDDREARDVGALVTLPSRSAAAPGADRAVLLAEGRLASLAPAGGVEAEGALDGGRAALELRVDAPGEDHHTAITDVVSEDVEVSSRERAVLLLPAPRPRPPPLPRQAEAAPDAAEAIPPPAMRSAPGAPTEGYRLEPDIDALEPPASSRRRSVRLVGTPAPLRQALFLPEGTVFTGEVLRLAREARGLTVEQLSDRTKVMRHHIENVEADRFGKLPANVYLRGILVAMAKELRLDGQKVARSYLGRLAPPAPAPVRSGQAG